jgi:uncharacterized protein (UPF0335 family)
MAGLNTGAEGTKAILEQYNKPLPSQEKKDATTAKMDEFAETNKTALRDLQEEMWSRFGATENIANLQALMPQIASKQAEFAKMQEDLRNQPISSRIIGGSQDRLARQSAIEMAGLGAMAQAYQGNIQLAQSMSTDAVNAKYRDQEMYLGSLRTQLDAISEDLSREDKARADSLNLVIAERERLIEEEKEKEININNIMIDAAEAGADTATLQAIMNAKTYREAIMKASKYLNIDTASPVPQKIGTGADGSDMFWNPITQSVMTANDLIRNELGDKGIISPSGNAYDMSTYATDPKHAQSVQNIINQIGKFNSIQDIDNYIQSERPGSTITGKMIAEASAKQGVGWEELVALIQHESLLGTSNVAKSNNNLGGVTWNSNFPAEMKGTARPSAEGGNYVKFTSMQDGVNSVAFELAKRKVEVADSTDAGLSRTDKIALDIFNGVGSFAKVSTKDFPAVQSAFSTLREQALASGDIEGVIRASAGGKDVDATTVTSFEKAYNVIGQLADLSNTIENGVTLSDGTKIKGATGPILGIIRSNNPYDEQAKLIQAQLTAIVPNLARGIYGEVGVLTDNDVKLYSQTLPNLKSTEDVRDLILSATIRSVQRSIENKIRVQAGLGRDVSGLLNSYQEIKATADSLQTGSTSQLSGEKTVEANYIDSLNLSGEQKEKGGFWNWLRGLFGG